MKLANATAIAVATLVLTLGAGCGGSDNMTLQSAATGSQNAAGATSVISGGTRGGTGGSAATNPSTGGRGMLAAIGNVVDGGGA